MVQYRYARGADEKIVDASQLANVEKGENWVFSCLGCNQPLVAKVHGNHKAPHFAHRADTTCSDETYLHQLGKMVFFEEFKKCRASSQPFEIELSYPLFCRKYECELQGSCRIEGSHVRSHDLAALCDDIQMEYPDGSFIPDLLLQDTRNGRLKIYVEIAVTHFLSENKKRSGERIIEIPIDSEADIAKIKSHRLTAQNCRFVNFTTESQSVTDSQCRCHDRLAYAFIVYDSGKSFLEESTLAGLVALRRRRQEVIRYFKLIVMRRDREYLPSRGNSFQRAVLEANKEGFPLRNCYLCRYQGDNFNGDNAQPIYCKHLKSTFGSNHAVNCKHFMLKTDDSCDMPRL